MALTVGNITLDCADPLKMSAFWAAAFEQPVADEANEFFAKILPWNGGPSYFFIRVAEGKTAKNRLHLDLSADDREVEVARLISLGATQVAEKDEWDVQWTVMNDPEGNEFCVSGNH
jgi:predicted enzyme related to lactoylglutathione lyase